MPAEHTHTTHHELQFIQQWLAEGRRLALATVVATWGSSPRPVGSHCVIDSCGAFVGSVSGGCIEGAVITEALEVIDSGVPRQLHFGVSDDSAWSVGLSCGGEMTISIQPIDQALAAQLQAVSVGLLERRESFLCVDLKGIEPCMLWSQGSVPEQWRARLDVLRRDQASALFDQRYFIRSYLPCYRLMIVGAVHIAQCLVPMAIAAGYQVQVIDPRRSFATTERFSGVMISHDWPDEFFAGGGLGTLDRQTAVVTLTHDPKIDDPALLAAVASECFYIGALGSSRTHEKRLQRLAEQVTASISQSQNTQTLNEQKTEKDNLMQQLVRIHGPVGLRLGGRSPEAIAVSILAQLTEQRFAGTKS